MSWNLYGLPYRDNSTDRKEAYDNELDKYGSIVDNYHVGFNQWNDKNKSFADFMDDITNGQFSEGHWDDKLETWLANTLTGDLDYSRQLEMMQLDQAFNSAEAEKNRQFNLDVANSAYQRQAEDLKKAGYNPALVLGGGASSVPSSSIGSSHHQGLNHIDAILPFLSGVVGSAFNLVASSMRNNTALNVAKMNTEKKNKTPSWFSSYKDDMFYNGGGGSILSDISGKHSTFANHKKGDDPFLDEFYDWIMSLEK